MSHQIFTYPLTIEEKYLDSFGHVNNAEYLTLFEQARWDLITNRGYDLKKIKDSGLGPTILEINIRFMRELRLHDEIMIESQMLSLKGKISRLRQRMLRGDQVCCIAEFVMALFDLKERKLVLPTPEWLHAIGWNE